MIFLYSIIGISLLVSIFVLFKNYRQSKKWETMFSSKNAEISQLRHVEEKLQQELGTLQTRLSHSIEDPVTQLQGWGLFEDRVNHSINESARYQFTMAVLYIDINDFKVINEALGYEIGDEVLNVISQRLKSSIRQVDNISRFSKDIFVLLLTQLGKPETAGVVAQRMLESLSQPVQVKENTLYLTASIGIAIYPSDGSDSAALFRNADKALSLAKERGKQNYQFYQEEFHSNSQRELALSTGLKRDSLLSEFEIYYQPILNSQTQKIFCMEALLNWKHPELGLIDSEDLFYHAEKNGKSNVISEWLLKEACKRFLHWRSIGFQPELLGISLSLKVLKNSQFIYHISQILQEYNFKPEWLLIEIKENLKQVPYESVEKIFNMLKYLGVKLAINNFGSSQFSIQDLKDFTVNYLKLDKALIGDVAQNQQTRELLTAILVLSRSLSMSVIVQGVESEEQMNTLTALGFQLVQGQFVGSSVPESEVPIHTDENPT